MGWASAWPHAAPAALGRRERALVLIEDQRAYADLIAEAVAQVVPGLRTVAFTRGEPAIRWLQEGTAKALPRAIFVDLGLPDMTGHAVISWLRQERRFADLPAIVLTGSAAAADIRRSALLQATTYEVKPDDWDGVVQLLIRCRRWLA